MRKSQELLLSLENSQSARMQKDGRFVLNGLQPAKTHTGTAELNEGRSYGALPNIKPSNKLYFVAGFFPLQSFDITKLLQQKKHKISLSTVWKL